MHNLRILRRTRFDWPPFGWSILDGYLYPSRWGWGRGNWMVEVWTPWFILRWDTV